MKQWRSEGDETAGKVSPSVKYPENSVEEPRSRTILVARNRTHSATGCNGSETAVDAQILKI
jgi:hypothetical protein